MKMTATDFMAPDAKVHRRRSRRRRAPTLVMKMPKAGPVLASACNVQLGIGRWSSSNLVTLRLAFVCKCMRIGFPISAIELNNPNGIWPGVQASNVYIHSVWIGARYVKRLDATNFAEFMLSHAGIEAIRGDCFFALKKLEPGLRNDEVQKACHAAH